MKLSRAAANRYTRTIGFLSEQAQMDLALAVASLDWDTADIKALEANRNYVIAKAWQIAQRYGTAAASEAADYFEACAAAAAPRAKIAAKVADSARIEGVDASVRYAAGALFKSGGADVKSFTDIVNGALCRMVVTAANETIAQSGKDAGVKVRYARIIGDENPCELCIDLASRGFVWAEDELIEPHDHCKCALVPGFGDNPELV